MLVKKTLEDQRAFKDSQGKLSQPKPISLPSNYKWETPSNGVYTVNWDATVDNLRNITVIRVIVRNREGQAIAIMRAS